MLCKLDWTSRVSKFSWPITFYLFILIPGVTIFANGGEKKAQEQSCRDQLQQMSLSPFLLILNPLFDLSQKIQRKSLLWLAWSMLER